MGCCLPTPPAKVEADLPHYDRNMSQEPWREVDASNLSVLSAHHLHVADTLRKTTYRSYQSGLTPPSIVRKVHTVPPSPSSPPPPHAHTAVPKLVLLSASPTSSVFTDGSHDVSCELIQETPETSRHGSGAMTSPPYESAGVSLSASSRGPRQAAGSSKRNLHCMVIPETPLHHCMVIPETPLHHCMVNHSMVVPETPLHKFYSPPECFIATTPVKTGSSNIAHPSNQVDLLAPDAPVRVKGRRDGVSLPGALVVNQSMTINNVTFIVESPYSTCHSSSSSSSSSSDIPTLVDMSCYTERFKSCSSHVECFQFDKNSGDMTMSPSTTSYYSAKLL